MYERSGYAPVTPFGHYACHPNALFYGKTLVAAQPRGRRPDLNSRLRAVRSPRT